MERSRDLEVNEDLEFQRREWRAERIGWALLFLLILVAAVGLFGHGPLSWTSATSRDGTLEVSFERFGRNGGTQSLVVRAGASSAADREWQLDVGDDYVGAVKFTSISPQPDATDRIPGGIRYTFSQAEPAADLEVTFELTPDSLWSVSGELRLAGHEPVTVQQFFFP